MANLRNLHCCSTPFSVKKFFKDSPWLNIPVERRAEIVIEPLYPRGRLLGGSPAGQDGPPQSKLAALAAARRKKENASFETKEVNGPVALLSTKLQKTTIARPLDEPRDRLATTSKSQEPSSRKYPAKKRPITEPTETQDRSPKRSQPELESLTKTKEIAEPAPIAHPSAFAQTLFGPSTSAEHAGRPLEQPSYLFPAYLKSNTVNNPFAGPSPDDVVQNAQTSKGKGSKRSGG